MTRFVGERLELLHSLGEGGCASVWLGRHRDTGALLAVKLVHPGGDEQSLADRFRREAEISARLSHRNIVRVHDFVHEPDGTSALVMEHLRGETLTEVLQRRGPFGALQAAAVLVPLLRGLEHAHARDVIHRDLKPSNVFLSVEPDGVVIPKLLDFGIAKAIDARAVLLTQEGQVLGTPAYMSPEQVRGETIGPASDVFAIGALAYELLTGRMAFHARSPHAAMMAILQHEVAPVETIPTELWAVVSRALCKKPEQRYESAQALREALEAAVGYTEESGAAALVELQPVVPVLPALPPRVPSSPGFAPSSVAPVTLGTLGARRPSQASLAETELALEPAIEPTWLPKPLGPKRRALAAMAACALVATVGLGFLGHGRTPPSISMRASLSAAGVSAPPPAEAPAATHPTTPAIAVPEAEAASAANGSARGASAKAPSKAAPLGSARPKAGAKPKHVARTPGF